MMMTKRKTSNFQANWQQNKQIVANYFPQRILEELIIINQYIILYTLSKTMQFCTNRSLIEKNPNSQSFLELEEEYCNLLQNLNERRNSLNMHVQYLTNNPNFQNIQNIATFNFVNKRQQMQRDKQLMDRQVGLEDHAQNLASIQILEERVSHYRKVIADKENEINYESCIGKRQKNITPHRQNFQKFEICQRGQTQIQNQIAILASLDKQFQALEFHIYSQLQKTSKKLIFEDPSPKEHGKSMVNMNQVQQYKDLIRLIKEEDKQAIQLEEESRQLEMLVEAEGELQKSLAFEYKSLQRYSGMVVKKDEIESKVSCSTQDEPRSAVTLRSISQR